VVEAAIELGARSLAPPRQVRWRPIVARSLGLTDAEMEMRGAEGDGEIAVHHADERRRMRRAKLPGGAFDDRAEHDLLPVVLEEIAQQRRKAAFVDRHGKDVDGVPIGIADASPLIAQRLLHGVSSLIHPCDARASKPTRTPKKM